MADIAAIQRIRDTKAKYGGDLQKRANVTGIGIGYVRKGGQLTDEIGLLVYVGKKLSITALAEEDKLPQLLDGVRVDVIETIAEAVARTGRFRPALGGSSIGQYPLVTAGTLGCILYRGGKQVILSNNHVLAAENKAALGDAIVQPGRVDGGQPGSDTIATLLDFVPISFKPEETNDVDAAVASPVSSKGVSAFIFEVGTLKGIASVTLGDVVTKSGRTTGLTKGKVVAIDLEIYVGYSAGSARYVNQVEISQLPEYPKMADGGDSGSALVTEEGKLCGLIFAADKATGIAFANRIEPILSRLRLEYRDTGPLPNPEPEPPSPTPNPEPPGPTPSTCKWGRAVAATMNVIFLQKLRGRRGRFTYVNP